MSSACSSVFTQARSAQYIGCSGSIASGTRLARACSSTAAMPSVTIRRAPARSFDPSGRPPTTSTRQHAPIVAASSIARRLSSIAARRPAASAAGNMPPRHRPVTVSPCCRISRAASPAPSSASLSRHGEMPRMPWRAQASIIWRRFHCSRTVAVFSDSRSGDGGATRGRAASAPGASASPGAGTAPAPAPALALAPVPAPPTLIASPARRCRGWPGAASCVRRPARGLAAARRHRRAGTAPTGARCGAPTAGRRPSRSGPGGR